MLQHDAILMHNANRLLMMWYVVMWTAAAHSSRQSSRSSCRRERKYVYDKKKEYKMSMV
jgi:hypothetical protein